MTLLITEDDVKRLPLGIEAAIPLIENTFRQSAEGVAENPPRFRMPFKKGFMQFGPAALHKERRAGFKLWANFGAARAGHGYDFLFDMDSGDMLAIIHSYWISKYRTSAASAVAVKHLSPPTASTVGLYSSGRQAEGQLEGACLVRPIRRAQVYSRNAEKRADFCRRMSERHNIEVVPVDKPEAAARNVDIVMTVTNAVEPVLFGDWLQRPGLVVAAGANHWYKREIDSAVVERADLIVVDEKEQARVEGGNLLRAIAEGRLTWDRVEDLGDVVTGRIKAPDFARANILFESHGLAINDIAMAAETYRLARAAGIGRDIEL